MLIRSACSKKSSKQCPWAAVDLSRYSHDPHNRKQRVTQFSKMADYGDSMLCAMQRSLLPGRRTDGRDALICWLGSAAVDGVEARLCWKIFRKSELSVT